MNNQTIKKYFGYQKFNREYAHMFYMVFKLEDEDNFSFKIEKLPLLEEDFKYSREELFPEICKIVKEFATQPVHGNKYELLFRDGQYYKQYLDVEERRVNNSLGNISARMTKRGLPCHSKYFWNGESYTYMWNGGNGFDSGLFVTENSNGMFAIVKHPYFINYGYNMLPK